MEYDKDGYETHHILEDIVLLNDEWEDATGIDFHFSPDAELEWDDEGLPHLIWSLVRNIDGETFPIGEYDGDDAEFIRLFVYAHRAAFGHMLGAPGPQQISQVYQKWHNKAMRAIDLDEQELLEEQDKYQHLGAPAKRTN